MKQVNRRPCRTKAREELRGQVGNLRLDIGNSAATLDKASKKKAVELSKKFYAKVRPSPTKSCCLGADAH
jgi:hypothetical protein